MRNTDQSNPRRRGKETQVLVKVEGNATFSTILLHFFQVLSREMRVTDREPLSCWPSVSGSRAGLCTIKCIRAPCTFPQLSSSRSPVAAQHSLPYSAALNKLLLNITHHCRCSLLTICISPTWQCKSACHLSFLSPSVPLSQCEIAQVANTDRECFNANRKGFNYLLDVSLELWTWNPFPLIKTKPVFGA